LLVLINAFVGGMVGLERTIIPQFAEQQFGLTSAAAVTSFIIAFGITKAIANYYYGRFANRFGRKNLLVLGWLIAIPIPFILIFAPSWNWVVFANILLGVSQGFTWSSTVVMKIDLVGPRNRGFAMGLNEFSGYFAVGVVAFATGYVANVYGVTPYPFYIGIGLSVVGLLLTVLFVRDTRGHVEQETTTDDTRQLENVFLDTSFRDRSLSSITQAGFVNNLNDAMIWGLLPVLLASMSYNSGEIGVVAAVYPAVWGIGQLGTGRLADLYPKKRLLFWGMLVQGVAIAGLSQFTSMPFLIAISVVLGLGTALVYPTFLSAIADSTRPQQRAESIGIFRFWRDMGYAAGAIISGVAAVVLGVGNAILLIGVITILSSIVIKLRMPD
jgi:MFS family permease